VRSCPQECACHLLRGSTHDVRSRKVRGSLNQSGASHAPGRAQLPIGDDLVETREAEGGAHRRESGALAKGSGCKAMDGCWRRRCVRGGDTQRGCIAGMRVACLEMGLPGCGHAASRACSVAIGTACGSRGGSQPQPLSLVPRTGRITDKRRRGNPDEGPTEESSGGIPRERGHPAGRRGSTRRKQRRHHRRPPLRPVFPPGGRLTRTPDARRPRAGGRWGTASATARGS
jgi:hypothetical protein